MDYSLQNHRSFIGKTVAELPAPSLVVSLPIVQRNIDALHRDVEELGIAFRPHVKTLKTTEITKLMLGSSGKYSGIIASTLAEIRGAMPLAEQGLMKECLYGIPICPSYLPQLAAFRSVVRILLMIDNEQQIDALEAFDAQESWDIFIKLDVGSHRAGVEQKTPALRHLVNRAEKSAATHIYGFYCHAGHSYSGRTAEDAEKTLNVEISSVLDAASLLPSSRDLVLSVGATPTAHVVKALKTQIPANLKLELHAGNFPVNDLQQVSTSLVRETDQAVRLVTEVCGVYPERNEALVNAGAIALSRETSAYEGFGLVVDKPSWYPVRLSQEHGILASKQDDDRVESEFKIGDKVYLTRERGNIYDWSMGVDTGQLDRLYFSSPFERKTNAIVVIVIATNNISINMSVHQHGIADASQKKLKASDLEKIKSVNVGHSQELRKNFSLFTILGMSFSLTNSWFGISTALVTGINSGGPVQLIYGIVIVTFTCGAVAVCLAELASAMPNAGGQYFWASQLASRRHARFASYMTGWAAWAGSLFTCASIALGVGMLCMGCIQMSNPALVIKPWMNFVAYQIVNTFCFLFNLSSRALPAITFGTLWTSILAFAVIILLVPIKAPTHMSARWVFTEFINNTGYSNNGVAYIVGLINPTWAFNGLDCATHMADEVSRPERVIPVAVLGTVGIGFVTSWLFAIGIMFSIQDFDAVAATSTGVPILELFYQATSSRSASITLLALIIMTGVGCLIASHTWQARLCWSFARDDALPASKYLSHIDAKLQVPIRAHIVSSAIVAVLGCLYLASYAAFNSMITACVVLLYVSYAIPVLCLLIRGRSNINHGPFWMGKFGHACNYVLLMWLCFTFVMYSFPSTYPVTADTMNYVSIVYVVVFLVSISWCGALL
ncbi:hypothetical protein G7054_g9918 [Neopestalotiopsis clavispora]|nr:hypothetical protein G7054_g9918 [Neopestalotiopsis clavispora]